MIRLFTLEPAKHEEVAIYAINLRIPNVYRIAKVALATEQFVTSALIGKLHEIYTVDKFKINYGTIPTPSPLARPPAPSQGDLAGYIFTACVDEK